MNSFQLAKFLSQLIASRRRKTPLHLDEEEEKRKKEPAKERQGRPDFIAAAWQWPSGAGRWLIGCRESLAPTEGRRRPPAGVGAWTAA